jgi:alpha-mannosidase
MPIPAPKRSRSRQWSLVKAGQWQALAGPVVVSRAEDRGDLWEIDRPLDGGSRIAMTGRPPVPQPGKAIFSGDSTAEPGTAAAGPVFSEFSAAHPFGNGAFGTRVRLYAGLRRIDIRTQLVNNEKFVRYQASFPTSIQGGRTVHEIPFGAVERPAAVEFPAQNWADYGDGKQGVAVLNRGLPGNLTTDGTMLLSLARATAIVAYGFGGGYEPGMSSDSGFELGRQLTFDYALVPHAGDWRQAGVYRDGMEFNHPLLARTAGTHSGELPKRWGLLDIAPQNVVVSALKPSADGTAVLRVYEATGQPTAAKLRLSATVEAAEEANLMEDSGHKLAVADNGLQFDLRAFEIKTIKLRLGAHAALSR